MGARIIEVFVLDRAGCWVLDWGLSRVFLSALGLGRTPDGVPAEGTPTPKSLKRVIDTQVGV